MKSAVDYVLVDMDGVLVDFMGSAMKAFGYTLVGEDDKGVIYSGEGHESLHYPFGEWNIPSVLGISSRSFWRRLHSNGSFFANLPATEDAKDIIKCIGNIPFFISTSPSLNPADATAKVQWLHKFFDDDTFSNYMVGKHKHLMGYNPRALLIDDSPDNCKAFQSRGGQALIWPQHWNSNHHYRGQRMSMLRNLLRGED